MKKEDFFKLVITKGLEYYTKPVNSNTTESGRDLCVVTGDGVLKYFTLDNELLNKIYSAFVGENKEYNFEMLAIEQRDEGKVLFLEEVTDQYANDNYRLCGLDTIEVLVDCKDSSKYLISAEGTIIVNTAGISEEMDETEVIYEYKGTRLAIMF